MKTKQFFLTLCLFFHFISNINSQATICCYLNCYGYIPYYVSFYKTSSEVSQNKPIENSTSSEKDILGNIFDAPLICSSEKKFSKGRCRKLIED